MRAESGGASIAYEVTGDGRPVVLLHGFPDSGRLWRHQVAPLADAGFKVIVPDMRGYGGSDKPSEVDAYNILYLVADVGAVLDDAGVDQAHVVGHDWGAAVAWALAAVTPDRVDHLVALSVGHPSSFRAGGLNSSKSRGTCCSSSSKASRNSGSPTMDGPGFATGAATPTRTP
jgi:pimeloyl-ACP methyl ester carboxylesterase